MEDSSSHEGGVPTPPAEPPDLASVPEFFPADALWERRFIEKISLSELAILLRGESGTGKTILARHIHWLSGRSGPLVEATAGELIEGLAEALLVGHVKGSFTGAIANRTGLIAWANGGTVFLDEIGDLPLNVQVLLLYLLENKEIRRTGEVRTRRVDVRFVFATNRNLEQLAAEGKFRQDLLYRIGHTWVTLPPLRDRRDDIVPLALAYLKVLVRRERMKVQPALSPAVADLFRVAPWEGNIRELQNVCELSLLMATNPARIGILDLPPRFVERLGKTAMKTHDNARSAAANAALEANHGNATKAAKAIGVSRRHFYRLLNGD